MGVWGEEAREFVIELIRIGGWDLRYSPHGQPYAALPDGFGNGEAGIKLHFIPKGGRVKVVGVIENSYVMGIRRPFAFVSIYKGVDEAARIIKRRLLPLYKSAWYEAQPVIAKWLEDHPNT